MSAIAMQPRMDAKPRKLIEKARELNTSDFPAVELQGRIGEAGSLFTRICWIQLE
jgi:hypothetical protein